jgi:hypothetical protein
MKRTAAAWMALGVSAALMSSRIPTAAGVGSGTLHTTALTFASSSSGTITFRVRTDIPADADGTSLQLEFVTDGNGTSPGAGGAGGAGGVPEPFPVPTTVTFGLAYDGAPIAGFGCNAQQATTGCSASPGSPNVSVLVSKAPSSVGRYAVTLSYPAGSSSVTGTFTLTIGGIPTSPSIRGLAYIVNGTFGAPLAPTGICGAGTGGAPGGSGGASGSGGSSGGGGPLCNAPFCVCFPAICEKLVWREWKIPLPEPCRCPPEWKTPIEEGFDRVLVVANPVNRAGQPIGAGMAQQVRFNVEGGKAIGPVVDGTIGEYLQAVEFRRGAPPRVSTTALGVTSEVIVAGPQSESSGGGGLTYVLVALLALALAALGFVTRRRGANQAR